MKLKLKNQVQLNDDDVWLGCLFIYSIKSDSGCMYVCVNMGDEVCQSLFQFDVVLVCLFMFI